MCIVGLRAAHYVLQYFVLLAVGSTRILKRKTKMTLQWKNKPLDKPLENGIQQLEYITLGCWCAECVLARKTNYV